jgi:hypothetical protein
MKHGKIIKKINEYFLSFTLSKVHFDSSDEVKHNDSYISLSYIPNGPKRVFLSDDDAAFDNTGTLRIFVFEKNPTRSMILLDDVYFFIRSLPRDKLRFTSLDVMGSPIRNDAGNLFISFIDFEVCASLDL